MSNVPKLPQVSADSRKLLFGTLIAHIDIDPEAEDEINMPLVDKQLFTALQNPDVLKAFISAINRSVIRTKYPHEHAKPGFKLDPRSSAPTLLDMIRRDPFKVGPKLPDIVNRKAEMLTSPWLKLTDEQATERFLAAGALSGFRRELPKGHTLAQHAGEAFTVVEKELWSHARLIVEDEQARAERAKPKGKKKPKNGTQFNKAA